MIKPLNNAIVIKPIDEEEKTESGIIIPQGEKKKKFVKGEVVAVGPDVKGYPWPEKEEDKVGQKILFPTKSLSDIEIDGMQLLVGTNDTAIALL